MFPGNALKGRNGWECIMNVSYVSPQRSVFREKISYRDRTSITKCSESANPMDGMLVYGRHQPTTPWLWRQFDIDTSSHFVQGARPSLPHLISTPPPVCMLSRFDLKYINAQVLSCIPTTLQVHQGGYMTQFNVKMTTTLVLKRMTNITMNEYKLTSLVLKRDLLWSYACCVLIH